MTGSFFHQHDPRADHNRLPGILPVTAIACIAAAGLYAVFGEAATVDGAILLLLGVFLAMSAVTLALWHRLERSLSASPAYARHLATSWRH
ncbi:hypothetical protein [Pannonibacter carbonis]|uniref:hypothetical protein n=1 Tax=Pannonibacter carbonis TaxID=2067569 RepID=UPI000D10030D|nr:hypothetical protein [Pannonibacter carbonis]